MPKIGTTIYCPFCKGFTVCKAVPPAQLREPANRRWYQEDYSDIAWFRRARQCTVCGKKFLTAEIKEELLEELVELRARLAKKNARTVREVIQRTPWLRRTETIPKRVAERLVEESAWWLTHSSGWPVHAPGHADRIRMTDHGWAVDFGANTFLVGKAIERCRNVLNDVFAEAAKGRLLTLSEIRRSLERQISGAVAGYNGDEYNGYYPVKEKQMVFGAQAINVEEAANFVLEEAKASDLFL